MIDNRLLTAWSAGSPTYGLWLAASEPVTVERMATAGYDYFCFDLQHGFMSYSSMLSCLASLGTTNSVPIARVPWNEPGIIGRVLDAGVLGVIIPMVNTVEQAEAAVRACHYAPVGSRSYGPTRAGRVHDGYFEAANENVACIPMIETAEAVANIEAITDVEGIDAIYIGPADLAVSYGLEPGSDNPASEFQEAIAKVVETAQRKGITPGIHGNPSIAQTRIDQGFKMVTVTTDIIALDAGIAAHLDQARSKSGASGTDGSSPY